MTATLPTLDYGREFEQRSEHFDRLIAKKFGSLLSREDREDLYQEAWAEVLAMGEQPKDLNGLLYTIGFRRGRDRIRKDGRLADNAEVAERALLATPALEPTPEEHMELREGALLCHEIIDIELLERERRIFRLRFDPQWELSPKEIQQAFDISQKRYEKVIGRAFKKIAAAFGMVEDGTWSERQLELLVRCEAGTASTAEMERARKLVAQDPKARAMLRDLRGAAVLLPMPLLTPHAATGGLLAHALASAKHHIASVAAKFPRVGRSSGGTAAAPGAHAGANLAVVAVGACLVASGGYCAAAGVPAPLKHHHDHPRAAATAPDQLASTATYSPIAYAPQRHTLTTPTRPKPKAKHHRLRRHHKQIAAAPANTSAPTTVTPPPTTTQVASKVAPTSKPAPSSGTGEFGP